MQEFVKVKTVIGVTVTIDKNLYNQNKGYFTLVDEPKKVTEKTTKQVKKAKNKAILSNKDTK